ncbi:MAG: hypothetical protein IPL40_01940 [Proteobacteria bacterium]|nr:hypothetical protein [Pseudomonadota bacterium]
MLTTPATLIPALVLLLACPLPACQEAMAPATDDGGRRCLPRCDASACASKACDGGCGACADGGAVALDQGASLCDAPMLWQQPAPLPLVAGSPNASDVSLRTLGRPAEALAQAQAFHATRLEWIYKNAPDYLAGAQAAGLFVGGSVNSTTGTQGRMLDLNGAPITAPWMTWTPTAAWGCANRPEFRAGLFAAAEVWISRGADGLQFDDPALNVSALSWTPAAGAAYGNPNNVNAGCFCKECQWKFHRHLWESGQTAVTRASVAASFTNELAQVFLAGSAFTVFYVSRSRSGWFGVGGNARNGAGSSSARLYLTRTAFFYDTVEDKLSWSLPAEAAEQAGVSTFTHDGRANGGTGQDAGTIGAFFNGASVGLRTAPGVAVLSAFGNGGHLSVPLQPAVGPPPAGDLAELIIFDRELDASERGAIEAYLGARYGIPVPSASARPPDQLADAADHLRVWLRADSITAAEGAAVPLWPARVGPDWVVPTGAVLPNGETAGAPTFLAHWQGAATPAAVHFDGGDDLLGPSWFSYRRRAVAAGSDPAKIPAVLRGEFRNFQLEAARRLLVELKAHVNAFAGRLVPFSGNLSDWSLHYASAFDFGMAELTLTADLGPHTYRERIAAARALGRRQLLTLPLPRKDRLSALCAAHCAAQSASCAAAGMTDWDDCPELVALARKGIATSYATGGLTQVPWDIFTVSGPRYYGRAEHYADLYGFVRDHARYFDGYEDLAVAGYDLVDARFSGSERLPVEVVGGSGKVAALVRGKPQDARAAIVIHLVEWDDAAPKPLTLRLSLHQFFGDPPASVELLLPAGAPRDGFSSVDLGDGLMALTVPALAPRGLVVVKPPTSGRCR